MGRREVKQKAKLMAKEIEERTKGKFFHIMMLINWY